MGHFRFKKSIKLAPGLKLNLNKKSTSLTFGGKGFHHTISSNGTNTTTVGIPGTGVSYTDTQRTFSPEYPYKSYENDTENRKHSTGDIGMPPEKEKKPFFQRTWFIILMLFFISPVGIFLMWRYKEWNTAVKIMISVFFILYFSFYCALIV